MFTPLPLHFCTLKANLISCQVQKCKGSGVNIYFLAAAFLAAGFFAAGFLAAAFFAGAAFLAGLLAAFLAAGFLTAAFLAAGFLAALGFLAAAFLAAGFLAAFLGFSTLTSLNLPAPLPDSLAILRDPFLMPALRAVRR